MAFPPTVREEINADTKIDMIVLLIPVVVDKLIARTAPNPPDKIPHISPITSLHMLAILLAFFIKEIDSFAPLILLLLIEWNVASLAVILAVPIPSKRMPKDITITK